MNLRVFQVYFVIFLIQLIEDIENFQLFHECGLSFENSGGFGFSFGGNDSDRNEAPWYDESQKI